MDQNKDAIMLVICSVDELIQNFQFELYSEREDDEKYQEVVLRPFQDSVNCIETLSTYFVCHNVSKK